jgi:hypothetical protein
MNIIPVYPTLTETNSCIHWGFNLGRPHETMRLVLLTHPPSMLSESMPRFAGMICREMFGRGRHIEVWTSRAIAAGQEWIFTG